jgi:hypothetical protein
MKNTKLFIEDVFTRPLYVSDTIHKQNNKLCKLKKLKLKIEQEITNITYDIAIDVVHNAMHGVHSN